MKLVSFRIRNFRSIVDSGWNNLAYDNVTGLIGQNESGKTSVLEGLKSFYDGNISENILRSDLSMPVVSCAFKFSDKQIYEIVERDLVPENFFNILEQEGKIILTRKWIDDKHSSLEIGNEEIKKLFEESEKREKENEKKIQLEIDNIIDSTNREIDELAQANIEKQNKQTELAEAKEKLKILEKELKDYSGSDISELQKTVEKSKIDVEKLKIELEKIEQKSRNKASIVDQLVEKANYAKKTNEAREKMEQAKISLEKAYADILEYQNKLENSSTNKERKSAQNRLDLANKFYFETNKKYEQAKEERIFQLGVTKKFFEGYQIQQAEEEIRREIQNAERSYTLEELGNLFFDHIPSFEFFEDFSSLLPDKIDLEDILIQNNSVEGYKAASNFLTIAGLTSDFFRQRNNRILKQKIENLNGEINVDFHEYWQQNIGKKNKIKIHFELEHYDINNPDKKGKPYLEFWIKDEKERLYPKQRSRGVRWFLSFYLELKATAIKNKQRSMILLIDEPGVSLHARAQEDVLKVFEDIKNDVQIVYTTHSPHLININKLYRLLAVQRAIEDDDFSETVIFDAEKLNAASTDTLSPIYTLMGTRISEQQIVQKKNNVLIEDVSTYYYLTSFFKLLNNKTDIYFLPATEVSNIPVLVNILLGWKLDFIVLLDDDEEGNLIYSELRKNLFWNDDEKARNRLIVLHKCKSIEDIFSTIDFKKHVIHKRVGITETNSEYIIDNNLSRPVLASGFMSHVDNNSLTIDDFDEETQKNIKGLVKNITDALL